MPIVTIKSAAQPFSKEFPKLMLHKPSGAIYLLEHPNKGVCIFSTYAGNIGKYGNALSNEGWEDYNESVTLQNK